MKDAELENKPARREPLVQVPFRCSVELRQRIHRALGNEIAKFGKSLSSNEFIKKLIDAGLREVGE